MKILDEPSALSSFDLSKIAEKNNFQTIEAKNIKDALNKISNRENKIIVIFGSLYLVGNALHELNIFLIQETIFDFVVAPFVALSSPDLNKSIVGIPLIPYLVGVFGS